MSDFQLLFRAVSRSFQPLFMPSNFKKYFSILLEISYIRIILTLLLAWAAAGLCVHLHVPLPWMIGPLLVTAATSMLGAPSLSWTPLRNAGQWVIGSALGLYFTPQVAALVASLWWAIALNIVWSLLLGLLFGAWLHRVHHGPGPLHVAGLSRITTYFASPIGAASEMTLLGERYGAQTDLVASAHSLRVMLVTLIIPFGFQWAGLHGLDSSLPGARFVQWPGLALLALLTGLGCWTMVRLKRTNPWFMGALLTALLLTACNVTLSAIPQGLTNAAQLVIGISLGVRFTQGFVHLAPRWLGSVALATVGMIALCCGFALLLAQFTPVHWATLLLGTSPGGIAEMSITAKVLQLGVPLVTAVHVTRLAAVLLLVEPMYRWFYQQPAQ
jgi:membrane AbrB-like protein